MSVAPATLGLDATLKEDGMDQSHGRAALMRRGEASERGGSARGPRLAKPLADDIVEVLMTARLVLGADRLPHPEHVVDHDTARAVLKAIWAAAIGAMPVEPKSACSSVGAVSSDLVGLLRAVKGLDEKVLLAQVRYRDQALHRVRDGLCMLGAARTSEELIDMASVAACDLGFDRSIVSRIEDSVWIPERTHIDGDAQWAKEVLEAGRANPQLLRPPLVETEMVRRKRAVLVDHVQDRSDVYVAISKASRSRSYCAAPVSVHGSVAGFLHADCFLQRRDVDESDRQVLSMFAEGLGQALSRTLVLDRLEALRAELDRLSKQVAAASGGLDGEVGWGGPVGTEELALAGSGGMASFRRSAPAGPILTRREVEVLQLMAAGDTNARIARRLVISEGTVKSHVKHILRKLGAANRAEAVSHWLHMAQGTAPEHRHATVARR